MTTTNTSTTNFNQTVQTMIRKQLEEELLPNLPHLMPGNFLAANFVNGSNATMRFLRIPRLPLQSDANIAGHTAGTAPWLNDGVAPTAQALAFGYQEFTAYQAGQRVELTDKALLESPLDLMAQAAKWVSRQAAETIDNYVAQVLAAGTNVLYAGAGNAARTDVSATDVLNGVLLRRAVQVNQAAAIPTFNDGGYHVIIHPAVVFDFEEDGDIGGWLSVGTYSAPDSIKNGEIGKYAGATFFQSPSARSFAGAGAGGVRVYSTLIFGPEAYAFGDYGTLTTHYVAPGGHGDELAQVASIGWKAMFGAVLLGEDANLGSPTIGRYIRIESASGM